jgi:Rieske Fe-S protein
MTEAVTSGQDAVPGTDADQGHCAARRTVLLCAGLAGAGAVVAGCSTAAVPFDANDAGQAPGAAAVAAAQPPVAATAAGTEAAAPKTAGKAAGKSSGPSGTPLGEAAAVPVGGGKIFTAAKVVVTQPTKGVFRAFSAVCTHVGCLCDQVTGGTINCPCHGAKFKITDGSVVAGPAPSPLAAAKITVANGKILLE